MSIPVDLRYEVDQLASVYAALATATSEQGILDHTLRELTDHYPAIDKADLKTPAVNAARSRYAQINGYEHRNAPPLGIIGNGKSESEAPSAQPPVYSKRPLILKQLLEGEPPPPPQEQIRNFTLAADVNVFSGDGDAGKTTTTLAACVATVVNRPVFGTLDIKLSGPVVLVVPEDGEAVARHHVEAIVAGLEPGITAEERASLERDLYIVGDDRRINLMTDSAELAELIAHVKPALVVLDPISSLIGAESEDTEHVAQSVCDNLRRDIARPFGTAVVLVGHLRKPGRDGNASVATVHDLKGSAGWANHARIVWLLSKPKGSNLITLRLAKSNRLQTGLEHQVTLHIDADPENQAHWLSARLTDANVGTSSQSFTPGKGRGINDNERRALLALDDRQEPGLRLSWSAWHDRSGIANRETFRNVRERLIDADLATAIATGNLTRNKSPEYAYAITDGGRQALITGWNRD